MERDDLIVDESYAKAAHHDEEHGRKIRKKIWMVTIILTVITAVEVGIGASIARGSGSWTAVKWAFIIMTLIKARYIVLSFMHLGDEKKGMKATILIPYIFFIVYLIFIALTESTYIHDLFYSTPVAG
jgi:cytochrome c oxidase subunit 4